MPPDVLADLPADRVTRIAVGPLAAGEVERVIEAGIGLRLSPSAARRAHRESGGNPFYALEIGRALDGADDPSPMPLAALPAARLAAMTPR